MQLAEWVAGHSTWRKYKGFRQVSRRRRGTAQTQHPTCFARRFLPQAVIRLQCRFRGTKARTLADEMKTIDHMARERYAEGMQLLR
jgi:hypothetical protein